LGFALEVTHPFRALPNYPRVFCRLWLFFCLDAKEPKSQGWKSNPNNLGQRQRARDPSRSARYLACTQCICRSNLASLADSSIVIPQAIL
jgi:hypothetical protein